jgi:lipoprotein-anchoring transpeptidase ErfK/SrfK
MTVEKRSGALAATGESHRTRQTPRVGGLAALALAAVLALTACDSGQGASDPAAAPATAANPPTTAPPTSKPPATTKPPGERTPVLSDGKASRSDIRWVQRRLGQIHPDLKEIVGKVDGRMGPQTRQALCVYRTIMQGLPSSLWKRVSNADLTSLAKTRTLPAFAFHKQTQTRTVAWVTKACQAVLEVVHGRYRHIMAATTGKPGHETPSGLHRIEWRWPGWHVSRKYPENGDMLDSQYFGPGIALHGVPSHEVHKQPSSHGCVRLYPADARILYRDLRVGIPVWVTGTFHFPS